jgi:adenosylcobinamide amidohydrolase
MADADDSIWETLHTLPTARVRRRGRHLVVDLLRPHLVVSTSVRNGGFAEHLRHLVNHQSCEGAGHDAQFRFITEQGQESYHDFVCSEIGVPPEMTATMGTAANMNYAAIVSKQDGDVTVAAIVTAGVHTNATCAGDPASWRETREGMVKVSAPPPADAAVAGAGAPTVAGTINTMLLVSEPVTPAALARVIITMTEGKSAALQRLAVPSRQSSDFATGTGTDQFCVATPREGGPPLTSASPHMKLGEMIGLAVREATMEALRWQNGLEPSYTRGLFHALGRYGLREATIFDDLRDRLSAEDLELLRRNKESVFYEPLVGAAAHALATVLDRVRHGTLPESAATDAMVQQAALLAANLAAQPDRVPEFRARLLRGDRSQPKPLVLAALALGWSEKWPRAPRSESR